MIADLAILRFIDSTLRSVCHFYPRVLHLREEFQKND